MDHGLEVRGECEAELSLGAGDLSVGKAKLDLDAGGLKMGDELLGK